MTSGAHLYDVLRRIRPVHELSARAVATALAGTDLSVPMRAVLEQLHDAGPLTVPDIARRLFVTRQGVQVLVDEARRLGHVETRPNPAHRRSHLMALSEGGRAAYEQLHDAELDTLGRIAADLPADDVTACVRVLDHLVAALADPPHPTEGPTP